MTDLWMVQTVDGNRVSGGPGGDGFTQAQADASVAERNERAEQMGIRARYEAVAFVPAPKV